MLRQVARTDSAQPQYADVVGELLSQDEEAAVLETRFGRVRVPLARVAAARLVQPSAADVLALEAVTERGWRAAERVMIGGWLMRANHGFTGRANTVLPLRQPDRPLNELIEDARDWYHERALLLRLMVPLPARRILDRALADRGFAADADIQVLARRIAEAAPADPQVQILPRPTELWLGRYDHHGRPLPAAGRDLLIRHPRAGFAAIQRGGDLVAIGRGAVDEGWLGVTAVYVQPAFRRQGAASAIVRALWAWAAREHHATHSYLQVANSNVAALALYDRLGYWHHHYYRYRSEPKSS